MIAEWAAQYVGLPYADRGRSRDGLDCWGLVRLVMLEQFGRVLPSYDRDYESADDEADVCGLVCTQRPLLKVLRVADPAPGDIVLLRLRGLLCHVGVCVGDGCVLHVRRGTATVIEDLSLIRWRRRVEGYYRA